MTVCQTLNSPFKLVQQMLPTFQFFAGSPRDSCHQSLFCAKHPSVYHKTSSSINRMLEVSPREFGHFLGGVVSHVLQVSLLVPSVCLSFVPPAAAGSASSSAASRHLPSLHGQCSGAFAGRARSGVTNTKARERCTGFLGFGRFSLDKSTASLRGA